MYSESKHLHCKHHCMCGCVCVRCVRKTETRSLHGGIPLLEETPLCSTPSSQEDIMGTAAGLFSHLWKMPSILHMSIEIGIFLSHLLVFTSHEKTSLTSDSPMHFTWGQSSLSGVVCAWKVTLEGAEPPTEQAHHMLPRTPTDPTYTHPPQAECIPERKSRESYASLLWGSLPLPLNPTPCGLGMFQDAALYALWLTPLLSVWKGHTRQLVNAPIRTRSAWSCSSFSHKWTDPLVITVTCETERRKRQKCEEPLDTSFEKKKSKGQLFLMTRSFWCSAISAVKS